MIQWAEKVYRKVSKTGGISYEGVKYYVRDKELRGKTVEVLKKNDNQTLSIFSESQKEYLAYFCMLRKW